MGFSFFCLFVLTSLNSNFLENFIFGHEIRPKRFVVEGIHNLRHLYVGGTILLEYPYLDI